MAWVLTTARPPPILPRPTLLESLTTRMGRTRTPSYPAFLEPSVVLVVPGADSIESLEYTLDADGEEVANKAEVRHIQKRRDRIVWLLWMWTRIENLWEGSEAKAWRTNFFVACSMMLYLITSIRRCSYFSRSLLKVVKLDRLHGKLTFGKLRFSKPSLHEARSSV